MGGLKTWVQILSLTCISCMALSRSLKLFMPQETLYDYHLQITQCMHLAPTPIPLIYFVLNSYLPIYVHIVSPLIKCKFLEGRDWFIFVSVPRTVPSA